MDSQSKIITMMSESYAIFFLSHGSTAIEKTSKLSDVLTAFDHFAKT